MEKIDLSFVLSVVESGGTLAISGPSPTRSGPRYSVSLESSSGAICADAYGLTLRSVLNDLERRWRSSAPDWHRQSKPDTANLDRLEPNR